MAADVTIQLIRWWQAEQYLASFGAYNISGATPQERLALGFRVAIYAILIVVFGVSYYLTRPRKGRTRQTRLD